jgi:CBS domain containing-hemolysin-like protein
MDSQMYVSPSSLVSVLDQMIRRLYEDDYDDVGVDDMIPVDEVDCYNDDGSLNMDRLDAFLDYEDEEEGTQHNLLLTLMMYCVSELDKMHHAQNYQKIQELQQTVNAMNASTTKKKRNRRQKRLAVRPRDVPNVVL